MWIQFSVGFYVTGLNETKPWFTSQGWQVSAKGGLNRGLNRFNPVRKKQVSAIGFCHYM